MNETTTAVVDKLKSLPRAQKPQGYGDKITSYVMSERTDGNMLLTWPDGHTHVHHRQVLVTPPWAKRDIEVDMRMADLLKELWRKGMRTQFSCEGWPDGNPNSPGESGYNRAYLLFDDEADANEFYRTTKSMLNILIAFEAATEGRGVVRFDSKCLGLVTILWDSI